MTILDRARGTRRIRIDLAQLADDLGKHVPSAEDLDLDAPDLDKVDLGKARETAEQVLHDAADRARQSLDRAGDRVRTLRSDIAHSADKVQADNPLDELGQRIRAVATTTGIRAAIARLERELPDTDKDRYARAYARGRVHARSKFMVVGLVAGVTTGVVAAILLDPKAGKARRDAIRRRASEVGGDVGRVAAAKARFATDKARGIAVERGLVKPSAEVTPSDIAIPVAAPAWPAEAGPLEHPLSAPAFGAHEALPEDLMAATTVTDPVDDAIRA